MMSLWTCNKAKPFNLSATIMLRVWVFSLLKAENDLSHSHDVIGRIPFIFRATLIFWNPENLMLFQVFSTLCGRGCWQLIQYVSYRSSLLFSDNAFGRSSLIKFANNEIFSFQCPFCGWWTIAINFRGIITKPLKIASVLLLSNLYYNSHMRQYNSRIVIVLL